MPGTPAEWICEWRVHEKGEQGDEQGQRDVEGVLFKLSHVGPHGKVAHAYPSA